MNSKTKLFSVLLLAVSSVANAQDKMSLAPICKMNRYQPDIVSWIPRSPSYFAKISPDGNDAYYIAAGNNILTLEETDNTRRNLKIPGDIDPVPCPDGKILTIPGLEIYEVATVKREGRNAKPILTDWENGGVYQSCAVLKSNGRTTTYRMITDNSGEVSYRDYDITFSSMTGVPAQVTPLGRTAKRCPGMNLKTLIVSKTGKYLSGYFPSTGTTRIVNIEGHGSTCETVLDLGYPTGKLEFNYDDSQVTFHLDYFRSEVGHYFSGVSSMVTKDVFTLDIETSGSKLVGKNLRRITTSTQKGSGSYYPSYTQDGRLMFINDDQNFFSFYVIRPDAVPAFDYIAPPTSGWPNGVPPEGTPADWKERLHASAIIGALWASRCQTNDQDVTAIEVASYVMNMPLATCRSLVREGWTPQRAIQMASESRFSRDTRFDTNMIRNMTAGYLESTCVNIPQAGPITTKFYGNKVLENLDGPRAVHHYCVGCHTSGGVLRLEDGSTMPNTMDFDKLEPWQISAAIMRLDMPAGQGRMPPNGFDSSTDHKTVVKRYLQCLLDEATNPTGRTCR